MKLQVDGLEEMLGGVKIGADQLHKAMREILRGEVGDVILDEVRARVSDHTRTGATLAAVEKEEGRGGGVRIGILGDRQHIGTWLESGTRMHLITPRRAQSLVFGGRFVEEAVHPGQRGKRIMQTTLRVVKSDAESELVRQLEEQLAPKMGAS